MNLQQAIEYVAGQTNGNDRYATMMQYGYSGRGMRGRECPAITGTRSQCQRFMAEVCKHVMSEALAGHDSDDLTDAELAVLERTISEANTVVEEAWQFTTDQLGYDIVMYWPDVEYKKS